jgi:hypothetical protein
MEKAGLDRYLTSGNGFLMLGVLWLIFWIGPAFFLFAEDSRWGHNFAIPLLFITVGLAYNFNKKSCQLIAMIASYVTIPALLGFWSWDTSTYVAFVFLVVVVVLFIVERDRNIELLHFNKRLDFWLNKHLMTFAYIGLVHMSLIFFFVRWFNADSFLVYLPVEHHVSTSSFNAMLFVLVIFSIMERNMEKIGRFSMARMGFVWSILMVIIPLVVINVLGE